MRFKNRYIICKLVINDVHTMDLLTEVDIVTAVRVSDIQTCMIYRNQ